MVQIDNYEANAKALATDRKVMCILYRWNRRAGFRPIQVGQPTAARLMKIGEKTFRRSVDRLTDARWLWAWRIDDTMYNYFVPDCGLAHIIRACARNRTAFDKVTAVSWDSSICIPSSETCFCLSKLASFQNPVFTKKIDHPPID